MSNLGALLARNQALEEAKNTEAMANKAARESAEAARRFALVQDFLTKTQAYVTTQIQAGEVNVELMLGFDGSRQAHTEVADLLTTGSTGTAAERLARPSHPYFCLWRDFSNWASGEGLVVSLDYSYDGEGRFSWHMLRAKPAPHAVRGISRI